MLRAISLEEVIWLAKRNTPIKNAIVQNMAIDSPDIDRIVFDKSMVLSCFFRNALSDFNDCTVDGCVFHCNGRGVYISGGRASNCRIEDSSGIELRDTLVKNFYCIGSSRTHPSIAASGLRLSQLGVYGFRGKISIVKSELEIHIEKSEAQAFFYQVDVERSKIIDTKFLDFSLLNSSVWDSVVERCRFNKAKFQTSNITNSKFANCVFNSAVFNNLSFFSSDLSSSEMKNIRYENVTSSNTLWPPDFSVGSLREHLPIVPPFSKRFRKWFGKSKVVSGGKPKVVYHGTENGGFKTFSKEKIDWHQPGFFFTDDIQLAGTYASWFSGEAPDPALHDGVKEGIYRVYLRAENPYVIDAGGGWWNRIKDEKFGVGEVSYIAARVMEAGYDALIVENVRDSNLADFYNAPATVYVVFDPLQIKSATANRGTFSLTDPNITRNPRRKTSRGRSRKTSR